MPADAPFWAALMQTEGDQGSLGTFHRYSQAKVSTEDRLEAQEGIQGPRAGSQEDEGKGSREEE